MAFAGAAFAAYLAFVALAWMRGANVPVLPHHKSAKPLTSADIYDLTRSAVAVAGLAAGVFAAVYAYRKQRVEEAASKRTDEEHLSSRYQDAADQLGSDKAAVRLAGVYALSRLADDWLEQRQTCINVLCAYFRMHKDGDELSSGEKEVRNTILGVLLDRLDPALPNSWRDYDYRLKGSFFDSDIYMPDGPGEGFIDLSESTFAGCRVRVENSYDQAVNVLNFERSVFKDDVRIEIKGHYSSGSLDFDGAHLLNGRLDFTSIYIDGGSLRFAATDFEGADVFFSGAHFLGGTADFTKANFAAGRIDFSHAEFKGGVAEFGYASYGGAELVLEDVEGEKPQGLPKDRWKPRKGEQAKG